MSISARNPMIAPPAIRPDEQILDTMVDLARAAKSHRIIVAGSEALDVYLGLLNRGFSHAATIAASRIPCGQHDVALLVGRHSTQALEALLVRILRFLDARATLAIWVDSEPQRGGRVQLLLKRLGFRVEAGAKCGRGFVLSAKRHEWDQVANVAQGLHEFGEWPKPDVRGALRMK
jgi:hypothetical protein